MVCVIAVGICARKILIAREAKFVVSMAAKRTVLTLVSFLLIIVLPCHMHAVFDYLIYLGLGLGLVL